MQQIYVYTGQPIKFLGEILIQGGLPIEVLQFNDKIESYSYGKTEDGRSFVIFNGKKGGISQIHFADKPVDLLKNKMAACIQPIIEEVRSALIINGGSNYYREVTPIDYSKPFMSFIYGGLVFASQAECLERDGSSYLFKDAEGMYFIYDTIRQEKTWWGDRISFNRLRAGGVNISPAITFTLAAAESLDDLPHSLLTKQGGMRRFPQAKLYEHVIKVFDKTYDIFGILISDYVKESDNINNYDYTKKKCLIQRKTFLSTGTKELIVVTKNSSYMKYADIYDAFEYRLPSEGAEIAANLGLPQADLYMGIKVADLFDGRYKQAKLIQVNNQTVCILGKIILSTDNHDLYELETTNGLQYALINKTDVEQPENPLLLDTFGKVLAHISKITTDPMLNINTLGEAYPQGFEAA